jgi:hypothetical protein
MDSDSLGIRIQPDANGFRWYLREDYRPNETSGWSATVREAILAVADHITQH